LLLSPPPPPPPRFFLPFPDVLASYMQADIYELISWNSRGGKASKLINTSSTASFLDKALQINEETKQKEIHVGYEEEINRRSKKSSNNNYYNETIKMNVIFINQPIRRCMT
jgi:hypothetical protein